LEPPLGSPQLRSLLRRALEEDGAWRDRTTLAVVGRGKRTKGEIIAKQSGILAGLPVAAEVFKILDKRCRLRPLAAEGAKVRRGQRVARVVGPARPFLSGERVALNLLSRLSGIATLTRNFSGRIAGPRLYDTRKTTPLWRALERYAVRLGGGRNHRFNLSDHVLIKDNHLSLGGGVGACVAAARKKYGKGESIEVEVENEAQALEALGAGADILLVDNADPRLVQKILGRAAGKAKVEISGGLTLANIRRYSRLRADRFSSGALTHSAPSLDFSLEYYPL
jgi:nicotinate-nucleotide pyrophosphorylase (carboxylating)